jgi:hypothetical protein
VDGVGKVYLPVMVKFDLPYSTIMEDWCKILEEDRAFMRSGTAGHEEGL